MNLCVCECVCVSEFVNFSTPDSFPIENGRTFTVFITKKKKNNALNNGTVYCYKISSHRVTEIYLKNFQLILQVQSINLQTHPSVHTVYTCKWSRPKSRCNTNGSHETKNT